MPDQFIQLPADSTGKKLDTSEVTVGGNVVERERMVLADDSNPVGLVPVQNIRPADGVYAPPVRPVPDMADPVVNLLEQQVRLLRAISFQLSFLHAPRLDVLNMDSSLFDDDKLAT